MVHQDHSKNVSRLLNLSSSARPTGTERFPNEVRLLLFACGRPSLQISVLGELDRRKHHARSLREFHGRAHASLIHANAHCYAICKFISWSPLNAACGDFIVSHRASAVITRGWWSRARFGLLGCEFKMFCEQCCASCCWCDVRMPKRVPWGTRG